MDSVGKCPDFHGCFSRIPYFVESQEEVEDLSKDFAYDIVSNAICNKKKKKKKNTNEYNTCARV